MAVATIAVAALADAAAQDPAPESQPASQPESQPGRESRPGVTKLTFYGGAIETRRYLTGDWGGVRQEWADKGFTADVEWTQVLQGVVKGGFTQKWEYEGSLDYILKADLMRMDLVPGALVTLRGETRYGDTINDTTGSLYPANLDGFVPLTIPRDDTIWITITELNWRQRVNDEFGVLAGKIQNLDIDQNEFASGRGRYQFMNMSFVLNPVLGLTTPYSTLAVGVEWDPHPDWKVTSVLMNTEDSSTTTGFDDFGDGGTWQTEARTQYRLGDLPGGANAVVNYAFDCDFQDIDNLVVLPPLAPTPFPDEASSWAVTVGGWQYLVAKEEKPDVKIDVADGRPDHEGIGLFGRVGLSDGDANPVRWFASFGLGGRGLIPGRVNDTYGIAYAYSDLHDTTETYGPLLEDQEEAVELYYDVALIGSVNLTADFQYIRGAFTTVDPAYVLGLRLNIRF
jgi:porin